MWPENTLARQAKYDSADEIKYNFEGAALPGKLTNEKHKRTFTLFSSPPRTVNISEDCVK